MYGSDLVRVNVISSNEGLDDADWREENIPVFVTRIRMLFEIVEKLKKAKKRKLSNPDKFIITRIEEAVYQAKEFYQQLRFRSATQLLLFNLLNDFSWYLEREEMNKSIQPSVEKYLQLLSPILPHVAEELWSKLGKKGFVFSTGLSGIGRKYHEAVRGEEFIQKTVEDINEIKKIVKTEPKEIYLIVAPKWKFDVYEQLKKGKINFTSFEKDLREKVANYLKLLRKKGKQAIIPRREQYSLLESAIPLMEKRFNSKVFVVYYEDTDIEKRETADIDKPAIYFR